MGYTFGKDESCQSVAEMFLTLQQKQVNHSDFDRLVEVVSWNMERASARLFEKVFTKTFFQ